MAKNVKGSKNIIVKAIILLLFCPFFWQSIFSIKSLIGEWQKVPVYGLQGVRATYSKKSLKPVEDLRWESLRFYHNNILARLLYNKVDLIVEEVWSFMAFLSPRFYFQAGDGSSFFPKETEPIPGILFPFWVWGILACVKNGFFKPIFLTLLFVFFAFLLGQRTISFLLPVLIMYVYFSTVGLDQIKNSKIRAAALFLVFSYSFYLIARMLWLLGMF